MKKHHGKGRRILNNSFVLLKMNEVIRNNGFRKKMSFLGPDLLLYISHPVHADNGVTGRRLLAK